MLNPRSFRGIMPEANVVDTISVEQLCEYPIRGFMHRDRFPLTRSKSSASHITMYTMPGVIPRTKFQSGVKLAFHMRVFGSSRLRPSQGYFYIINILPITSRFETLMHCSIFLPLRSANGAVMTSHHYLQCLTSHLERGHPRSLKIVDNVTRSVWWKCGNCDVGLEAIVCVRYTFGPS